MLTNTTIFAYGMISTILGFLAHPYQTMQKVVEKHVPLSFIFFPSVFCMIGWLIARELSWFFLGILPFLGVWWFLEVWWMTFWGMWQITLLYLYVRFSSIRE